MAITYVGASGLGSVAANPPTVNITLPALIVNDIIVIQVMSKNLTLPANALDTPTGYTEVGTRVTINAVANADDMHTAMFWKRATASDSGASVTISRAGTSTLNLEGIAYVFRGCVKSGDPFDAAGIVTNGDINPDTDIEFAAFDPAADRHVVYFAWHADDVTTTPTDISNGGFTFTFRDEQETTVGTDCTSLLWSADHDGTALAAVNKALTTTAGSSIGYVFALIPGGGGTASDDVLLRFGSLDSTTGTGLVTTSFTATGGAATVTGGMMLPYYLQLVQDI